MKKLLLAVLATYTFGTVAAQNFEPFSVKQLSSESIKDIEVETSGGNISVESSTADKSRIEVFIWPSNGKRKETISKEEIQKKLDEFYELNIGVVSNKLTATARSKSRKWDRNNSLSISFKIYVPSKVSTNLSTSGGNISLTDLDGQQKITTSGGNLTIDKVKGKLKGTTSGGNIDVKNSTDDISLTTSGGNIDAVNCKGMIKLTTSGGSLRLKDLTGTTEATTSGGNVEADMINGSLEAYTSGGNVDVEGLSGDLATGTSGGNIRVAITEAGKLIKIRNSGGDVSLQLPGNKGYDLALNAHKIKTDHLNNFSGDVEDSEIKGKLNGGGAKVDVDAGNGRLTLTIR